jgi:hypothetical protein
VQVNQETGLSKEFVDAFDEAVLLCSSGFDFSAEQKSALAAMISGLRLSQLLPMDDIQIRRGMDWPQNFFRTLEETISDCVSSFSFSAAEKLALESRVASYLGRPFSVDQRARS